MELQDLLDVDQKNEGFGKYVNDNQRRIIKSIILFGFHEAPIASCSIQLFERLQKLDESMKTSSIDLSANAAWGFSAQNNDVKKARTVDDPENDIREIEYMAKTDPSEVKTFCPKLTSGGNKKSFHRPCISLETESVDAIIAAFEKELEDGIVNGVAIEHDHTFDIDDSFSSYLNENYSSARLAKTRGLHKTLQNLHEPTDEKREFEKMRMKLRRGENEANEGVRHTFARAGRQIIASNRIGRSTSSERRKNFERAKKLNLKKQNSIDYRLATKRKEEIGSGEFVAVDAASNYEVRLRLYT